MVGITTLKNVYRFHKNFKNWKSAIFVLYFKKFPFEVYYRDGVKISIKCLSHLWMASFGFKFSYGDDESIIFDYQGKKVKFIGTENNGAIGDVFVEKELETLDVNGQDVIDIGASIGDSPVYFVLNGAKRVIAVEPFPYTFELLNKNLYINGVIERTKMVNCAIGGKTGTMRISQLLKNTVGMTATDVHDGVPINVLTIRNLLEDFNLNNNNVVLKMDCEGCEYEAIHTMSKCDFNKINEIFIEYHNGLNSLEYILNQNGYTTKVIPKGKRMGLLIGKRQLTGNAV